MEDFKLQGNNFFAKKEYDKALESYDKALKQNKENHVIYSNKCAVYLKMNDTENALNCAVKCTKLVPKWGKGWSRLGSSLYASNKNGQALTAFKKAEELNPNSFNLDMIKKIEKDLSKTDEETDEEESEEDIDMGVITDDNNTQTMPNMPNMANMPNMPNMNDMGQMKNLFDKMMSNSNFSEKMMDPNFQKKIMENRDNPMKAVQDPDIMNMMGIMMKEMNN